MASLDLLALGVVKTLTAALGALIVLYAARAYTRTRSRPLLLLALGMSVLTGGIVLEGAIFQLLGWDLSEAHVAEAFVTLAGYTILVASLRVQGARSPSNA